MRHDAITFTCLLFDSVEFRILWESSSLGVNSIVHFKRSMNLVSKGIRVRRAPAEPAKKIQIQNLTFNNIAQWEVRQLVIVVR